MRRVVVRENRVTVGAAWTALGTALRDIDARQPNARGGHLLDAWRRAWVSPREIGVVEPAWTTAYDVAKAASDLHAIALGSHRDAAIATWITDQAMAFRELLAWCAAAASLKMRDGGRVYQLLTEATLWEFMRRRP